MPEESGSEISKLTLSVRPLMSMPVEEAHRELTDAGIPYLDAESGNGQFDDLTSSNLDDMGSAADQNYPLESKLDKVTTEASKGGERAPNSVDTSQPSGEPKTSTKDGQPSPQVPRITGVTNASDKDAVTPEASDRHGHGKGASTGDVRSKKSRPKHKEQWDRRLLSYVRKKQEESPDADEQDGPSEHNLAVEVVARAAVCAYEKARGRVAEQMAQTHPGYDIISRNPLTGEERYIEVKGVDGEWNQTGVGLSRLQFSNAQDYGDRYWLYVVEFVSDSEHTRVHVIRSPATQVTSFMFDGNWRAAVTNEQVDPAMQYISGARINHKDLGIGQIVDVTFRGNTRLLTIQFDGKSQVTHNVPLNLHRMSIMEEPDVDNYS